jgi:hypothetical protein
VLGGDFKQHEITFEGSSGRLRKKVFFSATCLHSPIQGI